MGSSGLTVVDLGVLVILVLSGGLAFMRGLVREVFALGTWIGALAVAVFAYPLVKPLVASHIKNPLTADVATALGLFCAALLVLVPLGYFLSSLVRGGALTAIDRSLGLVFGLVRGALILSLMYLGVSWILPAAKDQPAALAEAKSRFLLDHGANILEGFLPGKGSGGPVIPLSLEAAVSPEQKTADDAKTLDRLSRPVPVAKPSGDDLSGYTDTIRDHLNALIEHSDTTSSEKAKP